jgi:hypothetical protein
MKKTLPYILIIAASYLVVAFIVNDINSSQWKDVDRMIVILVAIVSIGIYLIAEGIKKD